VTAVEAGESHYPDFSDGLAVQRVLDAVARSDELGMWVALPESVYVSKYIFESVLSIETTRTDDDGCMALTRMSAVSAGDFRPSHDVVPIHR